MKKFQFTLQKLYEVKKISEDQLMREQDQINKKLNELQNAKDALQTKFFEERKRYEAACQKGMHASEMQTFGDFFKFLLEEQKKLDDKMRACQIEKEKCTQKLWKIINEIKVLDKIKEEQFNSYNKELQKNDDKMLEDFLCGRM